MVVRTNIPEVTKLREGMLEFLLLNHPLDCPVCDRGGECDLQDFTFRYGPGISRFPITEKVHFKKAVPLSQHIELDQERCILCWRCVRYYDEITGEKEIVLQQRGVETLVATFNDRQLESKFQGNLPEVCPVGALTHREVPIRVASVGSAADCESSVPSARTAATSTSTAVTSRCAASPRATIRWSTTCGCVIAAATASPRGTAPNGSAGRGAQRRRVRATSRSRRRSPRRRGGCARSPRSTAQRRSA